MFEIVENELLYFTKLLPTIIIVVIAFDFIGSLLWNKR